MPHNAWIREYRVKCNCGQQYYKVDCPEGPQSNEPMEFECRCGVKHTVLPELSWPHESPQMGRPEGRVNNYRIRGIERAIGQQ